MTRTPRNAHPHRRRLGRAATVALAVAVAAAAAATPASAVDAIDPSLFRANPSEHPSTGAVDNGLTVSAREDTIKQDDQKLLADHSDSTEEDRKDDDWCLWSALAGLAAEFAQGQTPNVDETLETGIEGCLKSNFEGKPEVASVGWVAEALTLRDNLMLLEAMGESEANAWNRIASGASIELPPATWQAWFQADAAAVPPV